MTGQRRKKGELFFYGIFLILAVLVLYTLHPYLGVIAISLVTVVVLKPLFDWNMGNTWIRGRTRIATTVTLITFFLLIIIPVYLLGSRMISEIQELRVSVESDEFETFVESVLVRTEDFIRGIPGQEDFELDRDQLAENASEAAKSVMGWLADQALNLVASLPNLFISAIIFLIVVATLLPTLDNLDERVEQLSPMDVNITQIYLLKSREMIMSVVKGVFLLVILQGFIMGVFYWIAGVPFTVFWMLLSMIFGVLPVVGISFVVWPLAIIFLLMGNVTSALIILFGFYVIVNPLDLILRPKLVSKEAYLNFTLMLLALFGGLAVGGLLGMIYGPVIMVLFVTTIDVYADYYSDKPNEPEVVALDSGDADVPAPLSPEGAEETV